MFRKGYVAFQRSGGRNTIIVDLSWRKAPRLAVKLPDNPAALLLANPYPDLDETWYEDERERGWTLGPLDVIPDLRPVIEIAARFHPSAGPAIDAPDHEQVREQLRSGLPDDRCQARLLADVDRGRRTARERARSLPGQPPERCGAPR